MVLISVLNTYVSLDLIEKWLHPESVSETLPFAQIAEVLRQWLCIAVEQDSSFQVHLGLLQEANSHGFGELVTISKLLSSH